MQSYCFFDFVLCPLALTKVNCTLLLRVNLLCCSDRLEGTRERLEDTSRCFHLLDRALGWALATSKGLSRAGSDWKQLQVQVQHHLMAHPPPDPQQLTEMLQLARKLGNERLLDQCKVR